MNIKYGDTNLSVRYLEAFLQEEYNNTLRVSGIYDTYTHNNLVAYVNLPRVVSSEEMYDALVSNYSQIPIETENGTEYKSLTYCFAVVRTLTTITCTSKSVNKPDDLVVQAMNYLRLTLLDFGKKYGWDLTSFISYVDTNSEDEYKIVLTQEKRQNLIPLDSSSLINLSSENFVFNSKIQNNTFSGNVSGMCTMIVPCKPDTEYIFCHRFDNPDGEGGQNPVSIYIGSSSYIYPNTNTYSSVSNIDSYEVREEEGELVGGIVQGECVIYKTSSDANNILISYAYDDMSYNTSILVLKKNNLSVEDIDTDEFISEYWLVQSKFLDYLFGSTLNELSDEDDIYYIQNALQSILPKKYIDCNGVYTEDFRNIVKEYQELYKQNRFKDSRPRIKYSLGYIDTQTEAQILKDIDNGVQLYY